MKLNGNSLSITAQNLTRIFKAKAKTQRKCIVNDKSYYLADSLHKKHIKILVGKPHGKTKLRRPRYKWRGRHTLQQGIESKMERQ